MKIALSTWNKFHFFDLARQLEQAGVLSQIFTNLPRYRVANEQIPASKIETNPFPAILRYAAIQQGIKLPEFIERPLRTAVDDSQQRFVARRVQGDCDALIALSGAGLGGGRRVQANGGRFICERASTHILWVRQALAEEYARFGLDAPFFDPVMVKKELDEYAESDIVTVPSNFVRQTFLEQGVAPERVVVNSYGVDLSTFGRDEVARTDQEFRVIAVGQISLRKGTPYLLEAFKRLKHPNKRLLFVGSIQHEMKAVLSTLPLEGVEFLGAMPKGELRKVISGCDAFCISSIEEGMAKVTGEAMACGLPVVATENSGAGEIVTSGVEGFMVPAKDPAVIADRLQRLADDPALRERMSAAALARVQTVGGWRDYGARYVELVSRLTAGNSTT